MFLVATIVKSLENVVFPYKWITGIQLEKNICSGINHSDRLLAFYSATESKPADFGIALKDKFDEVNDACYIVSPLVYFGKFLTSNESIRNRIPH